MRRLGDTTLVLRANSQLADGALVPLEQFGLGGVTAYVGIGKMLCLLKANNGILAGRTAYPHLSGQSELPFC